jgi:hypothetical protein
MTRNASGPRVAVPEPAISTINAATKQHDQDQRIAVAVVYGVLLIAMPGAVFDRVMVKSCRWCQYVHLHHIAVGSRTTPIVRSPRCAPHRRYTA